VGAAEPRDADFEALFEEVFPLAQRVAFRVVGDPYAAEDIAAEAFARLYARWGRMRGEPGRTGWVLKVTGNLAIDAIRRKRPAPEPPRVVDGEEAVVLRMALAAALSALPQRQRAVVVLRYLADQSEEQVAQTLGISAGTVKAHAHRATQRLRRQLPDNEEVVIALHRA
jgi:RNA polymerase sigma-70 factor (sigma-E family)